MLIVGAKGFAIEILEICKQLNLLENLVFYDDISTDLPIKLFDQFKILKTPEEVSHHFANYSNQFCLGLGNPLLREKMTIKISDLGGELTTLVSPKSTIGSYNTIIEKGSNIMSGVVITNNVRIDKGTLVNLNTTIGHDVKIGKYCEICPGVHISGNVVIDDYCFLGTGSVILPNIKIGEHSIIGAGSVLTKDLLPFKKVKGIPAK
jgi:sugar O-acyltransferase (sialic acid O-acetyltransferase NeuD family)